MTNVYVYAKSCRAYIVPNRKAIKKYIGTRTRPPLYYRVGGCVFNFENDIPSKFLIRSRFVHGSHCG